MKQLPQGNSLEACFRGFSSTASDSHMQQQQHPHQQHEQQQQHQHPSHQEKQEKHHSSFSTQQQQQQQHQHQEHVRLSHREGPENAYAVLVESKRIKPDQAQVVALTKLQALHDELKTRPHHSHHPSSSSTSTHQVQQPTSVSNKHIKNEPRWR